MRGIIILSLVLAFALTSLVYAEPNLVSHWKFDEGSGTTAYDSAGDNDGTLVNGPTWTNGKIGGALNFDGVDDYVTVADDSSLDISSAITISAWVKLNDDVNGQAIVGKVASGGGYSEGGYHLVFSSGTGYSDGTFRLVFKKANGTAGTGSGNYGTNTNWDRVVSEKNNWQKNMWYYVAGTWDGTTNSQSLKMYVDGVPDANHTANQGTIKTNNNALQIGRTLYTSPQAQFDGKIDDVRIYDRALSAEEIEQLYWEGLGDIAFEPNPANGATGVDPNVVLSWSPGNYAASHDVYFGTDYNNVNDANTSSPEYKGNFDVNSWDPCGLAPMTTYYWRIDEVNEPNLWKGNVWSFDTPRPVIGLSATQFEFVAVEGGANPNDQILSIYNSGALTLNWHITYDCNWLSVEPNSGSSTGEADDVSLSVDITGLTGGTYNCNLIITDGNATNSPQIVGVELIVTGPMIELSATQFQFEAITGGANPDDQILSISNSGGGTLKWQITEDCNWLTVDPNSGTSIGEVDDVNLMVDISGLVAGIYTCNLTISDPNASNNPQIAGITLQVGDSDGILYVPSEYSTIQTAINAALNDHIVIVSAGTYKGDGNRDIDFLGKAITVRSTDPNDPNIISATIIDCNSSQSDPHRGFNFHNEEGPNSILAGFTITNGSTEYGSGIRCASSSPTIRQCVVCDNNDNPFCYCGGGIYCSGGAPTIVDCTIMGNQSAWGGGIYCDNSNPSIINCTIIDNVAHCFGHCCSMGGGGGGLYFNFTGDRNLMVENCIVSGNIAFFCGGGIFFDYYLGSATINNCTIVENLIDEWGSSYGGGIYYHLGSGGTIAVTNCILWENWDETGGMGESAQIYRYSGGPAVVNYCNIYGLTGALGGTGNIDVDPCFADPCNFDYHLQSQAGRWDPNSQTWVTDANTSPCIDAGNPGCPLGDEPNDANNVRINMGAYGGTAEASKTPADWRSIADLTNDWAVDVNDLGVFVNYWLDSGQCIPSDLDRNQFIDFTDFAIFANDWLWQ